MLGCVPTSPTNFWVPLPHHAVIVNLPKDVRIDAPPTRDYIETSARDVLRLYSWHEYRAAHNQRRETMKKLITRLAGGTVMLCAMNSALLAATFQDFENGLLDGWVVGGRQISGSGNWWGVSSYAGSNMGYLHHRSFTELHLTKSFAYSSGTVLSFDAAFSVNGDLSPSANGGSNYYSMVEYLLGFYDVSGNLLNGKFYAAATTTYPYTYPHVIPYNEFRPNGLQHYEHDMTALASGMGVDINNVNSFSLTFKGYSSWWSGNDMIIRFDNVATREAAPPPVPEPKTYAMLLAGLGLLGFTARRKKNRAA